VELLGLAFGVVVAIAVALAGLLLRATQRLSASQAELQQAASTQADSAVELAGERAKRSALQQAFDESQTGKAATEATILDLRTEREQLRRRLEPILDLEAERLRLAASLAEDRVSLEHEVQQAHAEAARQRRALESEITAARRMAAQEVSRAQEEARQIVEVARNQSAAELAALRAPREHLRQEIRELENTAANLKGTISELDEAATLQSFGYYHKRYSYGTSAQYERLLEQVCDEQKAMVKAKAAAVCPIEWTVNGSKREGQKQINQTLRLMLRAFNGEADAAIAKVTYKNFAVMEKRIQKSFEAINGLAEVQQCRLVPAYLNLRSKSWCWCMSTKRNSTRSARNSVGSASGCAMRRSPNVRSKKHDRRRRRTSVSMKLPSSKHDATLSRLTGQSRSASWQKWAN
jgi:hypothetical protein